MDLLRKMDFRVWAGLICVASALLIASFGRDSAAGANFDPATDKVLQDETVGYTLTYPEAWTAGEGPLAATGFTPGALCRHVEIVDFAPPPESGSGAGILHSFVQVCAKRLTDDLSLDDFMRATYGSALISQFEMGTIAGVPAYTGRPDGQSLIFLQTQDYRIQIYSAVVADGDRQVARTAQVNEILSSFSLSRPLSLRRASAAAQRSVCKPGGRFHRCRTLRCVRVAGGSATCQVAYRYRSSKARDPRRYHCRTRVKVRLRSAGADRVAVSRRIGTRCTRVR